MPRASSPGVGVTLTRAASSAASKGVTLSSSLVQAHAPDHSPPAGFGCLIRRVFAGCCQPLLGDGPSRRYLCNPCTVVWTHTPPQPSGALVRFFPEDIGLTIRFNRSACENIPAKQLQQGPRFRGCSHSLMFRPPYLLDPRVAPTVARSVLGSWALYTTQNSACYLPEQWHRYLTDTDNCQSWTFTSRIAALSAAPNRFAVGRPVEPRLLSCLAIEPSG